MSGGANLCFYSAKSKYSTDFLEALAASPYAREFRYVCVDAPPGGARPVLPPYVRAVPTLMIVGESEPRTDGRVMGWLMERRLRERESVATPGPGVRMGTAAPPTMAAAAGDAADFGGPTAFSSEIFGLGDEGFSFIGEDVTATNGSTNRLTGNMAGLADYGTLAMSDRRAGAAFTIMGGGAGAGVGSGVSMGGDVGGGAGASRQSEKAKAFDDAYARMMAEREASIPTAKPPPNPFG